MDKNELLKCPLCGLVFSADPKIKKGVCPECGKEYDELRARKYYESMAGLKGANLKEAHGEDYLKVRSLIDQADDLVAAEKYAEAEKAVNSALDLTECDYRVWMAMVRVKTRAYGDVKDVTHKYFLDKAIECADSDGKKDITKEYKPFYLKSHLSDDEMKNYTVEEYKVKYKKLESRLKNLIPDFLAATRRNKAVMWIFIVLFVLGVGAAVPLAVLSVSSIYLLLPFAAILASVLLLRAFISQKEKIRYFNDLLDLFDALPSLGIDEANGIKTLALMSDLSGRFEDNDPSVTMTSVFGKLDIELIDVAGDKAEKFIESKKTFRECYPYEN